MVDRYGGYNKAPCRIQYGYAHRLRWGGSALVSNLSMRRPVQAFVGSFAPPAGERRCTYERNRSSDARYYKKATQLQRQILQFVEAPAHHLGIRAIQDIFQEQKKRLSSLGDESICAGR